MSLIHDAMKVAQRERAGRSQTDKNPQVIDGFFPYVSSSSTRAGSRRALIAGFSAAAIVLLSITAWLMWPKNNAQKPGRAPIILPPPATVAKTAPAPDTAAAVQTQAPDAQIAAAQPQADAPSEPNRSRSGSASQPRAPQSEAGNSRQVAQGTIVADSGERRDPAPVSTIRAVTPRIDYEGQATALFNAGDLPGAKEKFALATRHAPNARAWTNYGVTLQRLGDLAGAASAYQSAIGLDANYLEAWLYQGRLAVEQGDVARAIPLFQRARAINPRSADVNVELARLEYDAKNWTEAKRFAEEALRGNAANSQAYWFLAVASDPLKDVEGSIRGYSGFLQHVGDAPDQAQFIGWARTRLAQLRVKP